MYKKYIEEIKPELEKAIDYLQKELAKIRTDRATPSLVEDIVVECFDQKLPLKQLAAISCPEERQIVIQPWDKNYIKSIIAAIRKANSELNPVPQAGIIRIKLPSLTKEYREKLIKKISAIREEARISIKRTRDEAWNSIKTAEEQGEITEDDKFRGKDELQKIVDQYNGKVNQIIEDKKAKIKS